MIVLNYPRVVNHERNTPGEFNPTLNIQETKVNEDIIQDAQSAGL